VNRHNIDKDDAVITTKSWIKNFIIKNNICPFAAPVFNDNSIAYRLWDHKRPIELFILKSIKELERSPHISTSIIILKNGYDDLYDFLALIDLANQINADNGFEGIYQIASFHPYYLFDRSNETDAANFSNRSPFPIVHLLREASIEKAIDSYGDTLQIPKDNIRNLRKLGYEKLNSSLKNKKWD
jgi:uncharacterized protein